MKLRTLTLSLLLLPLIGCGAVSAPPAPPAPGYTSPADQTLGQSLAALNAFVSQEKINYAQLTVAQQAPEKPFLNALIDATNVANAAYLAFHSGTGTLATAQANLSSALTAQANLTANKGVK
jgi:hypothetical protein